jgi:hypothetical protein
MRFFFLIARLYFSSFNFAAQKMDQNNPLDVNTNVDTISSILLWCKICSLFLILVTLFCFFLFFFY